MIGRRWILYKNRGALDCRDACLVCHQRLADGKRVIVSWSGLTCFLCWWQGGPK